MPQRLVEPFVASSVPRRLIHTRNSGGTRIVAPAVATVHLAAGTIAGVDTVVGVDTRCTARLTMMRYQRHRHWEHADGCNTATELIDYFISSKLLLLYQ